LREILNNELIDWLRTEYEFQKKEFKKVMNLINYVYFMTVALLLYIYGLAVFKFGFLVYFTDIFLDSLSKSLIFALWIITMANLFTLYKFIDIKNVYDILESVLSKLNNEYDLAIGEISKIILLKKRCIVYSYHVLHAVACSSTLTIALTLIIINLMYATLPDFLSIDKLGFINYTVITFVNCIGLYDVEWSLKLIDKKPGFWTYVKLTIFQALFIILMVYVIVQ